MDLVVAVEDLKYIIQNVVKTSICTKISKSVNFDEQ